MSSNQNNQQIDADTSRDTLIAVLSNKLDLLITTVNEIKQEMSGTRQEVVDMKLEINTLKNKDDAQQREIDKMNERGDKIKGWMMGLVGSGILAVIGFVAHTIVNLQ